MADEIIDKNKEEKLCRIHKVHGNNKPNAAVRADK